MTKTSATKLVAALLVSLTLPALAWAQTGSAGNNLTLAEGQTIEGNYYAVAETITVNGDVTGDVICAGKKVEINGQVSGDILCVAEQIIVKGLVQGSLRAIAGKIDLAPDARINRNLTVIGGTIYLEKNSEVSGDAMFLSGEFGQEGKINGNLYGSGGLAALAGEIRGNAVLRLGDNKQKPSLMVFKSANIGGNLYYTGRGAYVEDRASIVGQLVSEQRFNPMDNWRFGIGLWFKFLSVLGALLIGLLMLILFKKQLVTVADRMVAKPLSYMGWGLLMMILTPLLALFLAITLVGLPAAAVIMLSWLAVVIIAKPVTAFMVGLVIMGRYRHKTVKGKKLNHLDAPFITLLVGVVASYALFSLPVVGCLFSLVAAAWFVGAAWNCLLELRAKA